MWRWGLGLVMASACTGLLAVTKDDCIRLIEQHCQRLLQYSPLVTEAHGAYGLWPYQTAVLLFKLNGQVFSAQPLGAPAPANFVLGSNLRLSSEQYIRQISGIDNDFICQSHRHDGFQPIDICCFYDEVQPNPNRKRSRPDDLDSDEEGSGKKQYLQDQVVEPWSDQPELLFNEFDCPTFRVDP